MENTQHLHQQIERATTRLAQLKARDLLNQQRAQSREREAQRKRQMRRRGELGQLVIDAGCQDLANGEIVAALLDYRSTYRDTGSRAEAMARGDAHLAAGAAEGARRPS
ncbi:conjugal transfer protein TraD [Luteimonas sp. RD2P54]|uniref:Conjugal transfer protein TraD n=1 Tax=Luteimonas endophytica TaxID=3042023 RepID=A0ABT6JBL5_9GAMM|nr:conjugal transfer protein TraD [Luteimonas endophytica]MDH5824221.1 conjugal transfer protein TraD [Luteimonas endophytica]